MISLSPATVAEIERSRAEMQAAIAAGWARIRGSYGADEDLGVPQVRPVVSGANALAKAIWRTATPPCDACDLWDRCATQRLACRSFELYVGGTNRPRRGLPTREIYDSVFQAEDHETITTPHCTAEGCDKPTVSRGLCSRHYARQWRAGLRAPPNPKAEAVPAAQAPEGGGNGSNQHNKREQPTKLVSSKLSTGGGDRRSPEAQLDHSNNIRVKSAGTRADYITGCDRPVAHRSLCSRHYSRAWRAGRKAVANATPQAGNDGVRRRIVPASACERCKCNTSSRCPRVPTQRVTAAFQLDSDESKNSGNSAVSDSDESPTRRRARGGAST